MISRGSGADGIVMLGVLLERGETKERPFGALSRFLQRLTGRADSEGVLVVGFEPDDVDLEEGRVDATRWLGLRRGWMSLETRLPDVLWNRYFRRDEEELIQALQRQGMPLINEGLLNKWDCHQWLLTNVRLQEHLPETHLLEDAGTITDMLTRHKVLFMKPVAGSIGRGIVRAEPDPSGFVRLQYVSRDRGELKETVATPKQLDRWVRERKRADRYIVQQGLDLKVFHGRSADVRVLVQKDGRGHWQVTGMGCRVAAHGRFTANLHTGGQGVPVKMLADAVFPESPNNAERLIRDLGSLSLATAAQVESGVGGMGEMGLDFGVDSAGKIWVIEQNAQPGRGIFEHLGREDLSELAYRRPVQYARHLATTKSARAAGHRRHNG